MISEHEVLYLSGATDINYEMAMELSKHLKSLAEMYLEEPA